MELLKTINLESVPPDLEARMERRQSSRAVVFDADHKVAVLHVQKKGYYKLPGGGVEEGEDLVTAVKRECVEELGCEIVLDQELGRVIEYRKKFNIIQESFCYLAHVVGDKGVPAFTEDEIRDDYRIEWVSLDQAIQLVSDASRATEYQASYILPRELVFLFKAREILSTN